MSKARYFAGFFSHILFLIGKAASKLEYILIANIDTTPAVGAVGRQDYRSNTILRTFQRRFDDLGLGADNEAIHAVVALVTLGRTDSQRTVMTKQAIEGTDGTDLSAPTVSADQQVEQEDAENNQPGHPHSKNKAPK